MTQVFTYSLFQSPRAMAMNNHRGIDTAACHFIKQGFSLVDGFVYPKSPEINGVVACLHGNGYLCNSPFIDDGRFFLFFPGVLFTLTMWWYQQFFKTVLRGDGVSKNQFCGIIPVVNLVNGAIGFKGLNV